MHIPSLLRVALIASIAALLGGAAPCDPCSLSGGTYRTAAPPGWDGHRKLPLLMFLHGWQATGSDMLGNTSVTGPAAERGFLLIAPDGIGRSWSYTGSPSHARDDLAFLHSVLADVQARWPIDRRTVIASGFSIGGSMVWELACHRPEGFTAFLPFSGGFWHPMPEACQGGPVDLRHVHGRDDTTVPLTGRLLNNGYAQADIRQGFTRFIAEDRCAQAPQRHVRQGDLNCDLWTACASGRQLQLCLRPGDHSVEAANMQAGLRWALTLPAR